LTAFFKPLFYGARLYLIALHQLPPQSLKKDPYVIMDRKTMRQNIFEYSEVNYNKKRRRSFLGYLSPEKYEELNVAQQSAHSGWIRSDITKAINDLCI